MSFHVLIPPADHAALQRHSKRLGQSAAEYLRRALRRALDEEELGGAVSSPVPAGGAGPVDLPLPVPAADAEDF